MINTSSRAYLFEGDDIVADEAYILGVTTDLDRAARGIIEGLRWDAEFVDEDLSQGDGALVASHGLTELELGPHERELE